MPLTCVLYWDYLRRSQGMFVKINKRRDKHGEMTYTASIMRSEAERSI